jgi:protein ImuA
MIMIARRSLLHRLRQAVTEIEGQETDIGLRAWRLALGVEAIDARLQGGLAPAGLHEIIPATWRDLSAAAGFALALAARAAARGGEALWISTDFAAAETGGPYGPGCDLYGLPTERLLILKVVRPLDALRAMEEALRCPALSSVIVELPEEGKAADLTATRRLSVAARAGGGFGFLLRHRQPTRASASETLWKIAAARSRPDALGGLGRAAFLLSLVKNRCGPIGRWHVAWNPHERIFSPTPVAVAEAPVDRSPLAAFAAAG